MLLVKYSQSHERHRKNVYIKVFSWHFLSFLTFFQNVGLFFCRDRFFNFFDKYPQISFHFSILSILSHPFLSFRVGGIGRKALKYHWNIIFPKSIFLIIFVPRPLLSPLLSQWPEGPGPAGPGVDAINKYEYRAKNTDIELSISY